MSGGDAVIYHTRAMNADDALRNQAFHKRPAVKLQCKA
jgi:hypothetical protein